MKSYAEFFKKSIVFILGIHILFIQVKFEIFHFVKIGPNICRIAINSLKIFNCRKKTSGFCILELKLHNWYCHKVQVHQVLANTRPRLAGVVHTRKSGMNRVSVKILRHHSRPLMINRMTALVKAFFIDAYVYACRLEP
jgi:hypothetical protein